MLQAHTPLPDKHSASNTARSCSSAKTISTETTTTISTFRLPWCCSSTLRQRQVGLIGKNTGQQNSNNHIKQKAAIFSLKLCCLSLSVAVLACQEGKTKSIFSSILDLSLCRSGGCRWDRQEDQQTQVLLARRCSEWSHGHSSVQVETHSSEPRRHSRSHITKSPSGVDFGRKRSVRNTVCSCMCSLFTRHSCISTEVDSLAQVYSPNKQKGEKHWE